MKPIKTDHITIHTPDREMLSVADEIIDTAPLALVIDSYNTSLNGIKGIRPMDTLETFFEHQPPAVYMKAFETGANWTQGQLLIKGTFDFDAKWFVPSHPTSGSEQLLVSLEDKDIRPFVKRQLHYFDAEDLQTFISNYSIRILDYLSPEELAELD